MRCNKLFELHDHAAFPPFLRDLVTDALESLWRFGNSYKPILPRLHATLTDAGTHKILDLCSGGGGPWPSLSPHLEPSSTHPITICLTDKYPNQQAFQQANTNPAITFEERSVDAAHVPADLSGFRTIFSAFHHFSPPQARNVLADAFHHGQGIAIFEAARPAFKTMLVICSIPLLSLVLAPTIRPFRWPRLLFTYVIPVVPFVLLVDGLVSCLRAYSQQELHSLVQGLSTPTYSWKIGEEHGGLLPITYLIGHPVSAKQPLTAV
jgi:hypothetical protein